MTVQLSNDISEFLNLDTTKNFLAVATKFINILEDKNLTKDEFLKRSHSALIQLYLAGHELQEIQLKYVNDDTDFDRDKLFDNKNADSVSKLGQDAFYWEIFDPRYFEEKGQSKSGWTIADKEASQGWLIDDFADIYRDLKIELEKINKVATDEAIEDALWQLKFGFRNHWGGHCISALRYLHYFSYDTK